jgi:hypothetical protein
MRFSIPLVLFLLLVSSVSRADLPQNDLWKEDVMPMDDDVSRERFEKIIDDIAEIYKPIVKDLGGNLVFEKNWTDSTVNAYASRAGKTWTVAMFGGLARRPEVTPDGFALVVLHEIGHHISGFPFYDGEWASSEGGSDWYATGAGAKLIWTDAQENAAIAASAPMSYKKWCSGKGEDLCVRSLLAGQSLANLLAKLNQEGVPSYETPDTSIATKIFESHPPAQQRLDTYLAGAICKKSFPTSYIPGLSSGGVGYNTRESEREAIKAGCANYPLSWYASPK